MRSVSLLLTFLAMTLSVRTASAQRATLAVTARILPSPAAMATGQITPRVESGHTIVATGQLSGTASVSPITSPSAAPGFAEFKLGMTVTTNVQYQVAVSSNVGQVRVETRSAQGRQEISYRVPTSVGSQAPAAVTVTLTAASIS